LIPFFIHWKKGDVPPLTGVAVNITGVPWHAGFMEAVIETLAGKFGLTIIIIEFDVAGFPVGQDTFDVSSQVTISPLFGG
jgi:hypothetical protein